jgi:Flp pilus assembly protein TadG
MFGFLKKLWRDRRGNTLVIAGAALPMLIGAAGLATDTIQWTLWKRQLQRAADSAAIAGVYERESASGATTTVDTAVTHDLTLNLHTYYALKTGNTNCSGTCKIEFPADSGVETDQVKVTLALQQRLPFSSLFLSSPPTITAVATAAAISSGGNACVQALEKNASQTGITNSGNTTIYMPDCVMYSNSPAANSAAAGGSSSVTAKAISTVGGVAESNNWNVTAYHPYSPALSDPFANTPVSNNGTPNPSDMHCVSQALSASTNFSSLPSGTNCFSSLSVGANKSLTMPANFGPIYINGGSANLQGSFTCDGCTIVLTNSSPASNATIGTISSNAQANTNLTAPRDGDYKGIAIYQDRRAVDCSGCNKLNGGSNSIITGAVYFPSQEIWFNGGTQPAMTCTMLVARRVTFTGNSKFKGLSDCVDEGLPQTDSVKMIRLVA